MARFKVKTFYFAALQLEAASGLWQKARATHREDRAGRWLHVADFQLCLGNADFKRSTGFAEVGRVFAGCVGLQVAGTRVLVRAVKFQAEVAEGVNTEADSALSEARAEVAEDALGPVFIIYCTVCLVTVVVVVAKQHVQCAVFYKALGIGLITDEGCSRCQLGAARSYGQCDCAPLHHSHRDLLLWFFKKSCRLPTCFFIWEALSFCVGANLYHADHVGDSYKPILSASLRWCRKCRLSMSQLCSSCYQTPQLRRYF